jgi:hypothetical protein
MRGKTCAAMLDRATRKMPPALRATADFCTGTTWHEKDRGRDGDRTRPSLRTGLAELPHPALQLVSPRQGTGCASSQSRSRLSNFSSAK